MREPVFQFLRTDLTRGPMTVFPDACPLDRNAQTRVLVQGAPLRRRGGVVCCGHHLKH